MGWKFVQLGRVVGTASVSQAIKRGNLLLGVLPITVLFLLWIPCIAAVFLLDIPRIWLFGAVLVPFLCSMAIWDRMVTRWRIWAYERVRNVHELVQVARSEKLIPAEGSWLERLEWRTRAERELLAALAVRFRTPDEFLDDPSVGERAAAPHSSSCFFPYVASTLGCSLPGTCA